MSSSATPTAHVIASAVNARSTSAVQFTREALGRLTATEPRIDAFLDTFPDAALRHAALIDERIASGEQLPLAGVPIAIKDNLVIGPDLHTPGDAMGYGGRTTCASRILENYRSPFTATSVQRLIDAGAIIIGKTNMDEFAMGSSCEHSAFKVTRNPHDPDHVPGGSSGGSAAAVGAGVVPIALGSDTGGSIRQPASYCGMYGLKPTYGRVSRSGLVAYASSLDQVGPMASDLPDLALATQVICATDPLDSTSSSRAGEWNLGSSGASSIVDALTKPIIGLTIGVPAQARSAANHPDVTRVLNETIVALQRIGATVVDVDLPMTDYGIAAYYIVAAAEASSNLARFDGIRYGRRASLEPGQGLVDLYCRSRSEGFGQEVQRRIMLGTYVLSSGYYDAYYNTALKARRLIKQDFDTCFAGTSSAPACHAILMPAAPGPAFKIGEKSSDPLALYLEDVYTVGVNLAGLPGLTIPAGWTAASPRLPIGMQLIGRAFDELTLLRIASMLKLSASPQ